MNYIERIRKFGREANPFFVMMGIEVDTIEEGSAAISMKIRPDMLNGEDYLQGGIFTALADEAMVLAIYAVLDEGERIATISETTSFMTAAGRGELVAGGRVIKRGRRVIFAEGEVTLREAPDRILSRTSAAFAVIRN